MKDYKIVTSSSDKKLVIVECPNNKGIEFWKVYIKKSNINEADQLCSVAIVVKNEIIIDSSSDVLLFAEELKAFEKGDNIFLSYTKRTVDGEIEESLVVNLCSGEKVYISRLVSRTLASLIINSLNANTLNNLQTIEQKFYIGVWAELINEFSNGSKKDVLLEESINNTFEDFVKKNGLFISIKNNGEYTFTDVLKEKGSNTNKFFLVIKLYKVMKYISRYETRSIEFKIALNIHFVINAINYKFADLDEVLEVTNITNYFNEEKIREDFDFINENIEIFENAYEKISNKIKSEAILSDEFSYY